MLMILASSALQSTTTTNVTAFSQVNYNNGNPEIKNASIDVAVDVTAFGQACPYGPHDKCTVSVRYQDAGGGGITYILSESRVYGGGSFDNHSSGGVTDTVPSFNVVTVAAWTRDLHGGEITVSSQSFTRATWSY